MAGLDRRKDVFYHIEEASNRKDCRTLDFSHIRILWNTDKGRLDGLGEGRPS